MSTDSPVRPYPALVADEPDPPRKVYRYSYEEVVLVCDLLVSNGWKALDRRRDPLVAELSSLMRQMHPERAAESEKYRNVNGIGHKIYDIAVHREGYRGAPKNGGQHEKPVLEAFEQRPAEMHELAMAIRASITEPVPDTAPPALLDLDQEYEEGSCFERRHLGRGRSPEARSDKIKRARALHGAIRCEACDFDFEAIYGDHGRDYIECHHRNPLSAVGTSKTKLADLALLCSNCHRMIHRCKPWLHC